jgi:predicted DNA-binding transcriptional regulator YafY
VRKRTLHVEYFSAYRGQMTERDLDVLLVFRDLDDWYAVCWDHGHGDVRDFNAGRFSRIEETGRTFEEPAGWDGDAYLKKGFGMFRGGADVTVEVEFDAFESRYIRERQVHPTERRTELGDGRLRVVFETTEKALEQVARWVMQHGEHAEVLRPPELREMLLARLERTLAWYQSGADEGERCVTANILTEHSSDEGVSNKVCKSPLDR